MSRAYLCFLYGLTGQLIQLINFVASETSVVDMTVSMTIGSHFTSNAFVEVDVSAESYSLVKALRIDPRASQGCFERISSHTCECALPFTAGSSVWNVEFFVTPETSAGAFGDKCSGQAENITFLLNFFYVCFQPLTGVKRFFFDKKYFFPLPLFYRCTSSISSAATSATPAA